jgi:hypothetical protein
VELCRIQRAGNPWAAAGMRPFPIANKMSNAYAYDAQSHEAMASARVGLSNSRRSTLRSRAKERALAEVRPSSCSTRASRGAPRSRDVARARALAEPSQAGRLPCDSWCAPKDGAEMVSRRALFGAGRPRASARGGRRQELALARAHGTDDSFGARGESGDWSKGTCLERSVPCARARVAPRSSERTRLRNHECEETPGERSGSRSMLVGSVARRVEGSAVGRPAAAPDQASRDLASSNGMEATRSHRTERTARRLALTRDSRLR